MTIDLSNAPGWLMCIPVLVAGAVALSAEARRWVDTLRGDPPSAPSRKKSKS